MRTTHQSAILILLVGTADVLVTADTPSKSLVALPSLTTEKDRIDYVQQVLCDRFEYVEKGLRKSDFKNWVHQRGGEATIFSMHGVDVNFEIDPEQSELELELNVFPLSKQRKNDPFLSDRMNLDLSNFTAPSEHYQGDFAEWDNRTPSYLQLTLRAMKLSIHFGPVVSTTWLAFLSRTFRERVWYNWVASCLASSGAAFIKWGQWASTRSDMFPLALCDALSDLQNSAPEHAWDFTQTLVEKSLDIPQGSLLEVFSSFDTEPLASGSIAQIHKARLKNGQLVAAKVRHPRVAQLMDMDFRIMALAAKICDWIPALRWLHIKDSVSQFSHTMAWQAHLHVEAHHLEVFNHNFRNWNHVRFPEPFYASSSLILESFEPGRICTDIIDWYDDQASNYEGKVKGYELIPVDMAKFLVTSGVAVYLKMLLVDNLMHADLHPGNIMLDVPHPETHSDGLLKLPASIPKLTVTLVDAGMVAQLTDEESSTFIGLMAALGEGNGRSAAEFALRFSIENHMSGKEKELFKKEMEGLFAERCQGYGTQVDVGNVLRGVLGLIRNHQVRIDSNYATLVVNVLCIESLARRVCPSYNILDAAKPMLETFRKLCFDEDGVTPKRNQKLIKKAKSMMALMNIKKDRADAAFFKKIAAERGPLSLAAPEGSN